MGRRDETRLVTATGSWLTCKTNLLIDFNGDGRFDAGTERFCSRGCSTCRARGTSSVRTYLGNRLAIEPSEGAPARFGWLFRPRGPELGGQGGREVRDGDRAHDGSVFRTFRGSEPTSRTSG